MSPALRASKAEKSLRRNGSVAPNVRRRARGALFEIAPILAFTVGFALTQRLAVALTVAVAAGIAVGVHHRLRREPLRRAVAATALVGLGGLLALRSGQASNFFLPGLSFHAVIVPANLVLLAARLPLLGLVTGLVTGEGTRWRHCRIRRRAFARGSLVLLGPPVVLMAVGLPLYLAGNTVALGVSEVCGPFLFTVGAVLAWRTYRRATGAHECGTHA